MIAYKGRTPGDKIDERSIYIYNQEQGTQELFVRIGNRALKQFFKNDSLNKKLQKVNQNLTKIKPSFYPSDIDIHPINRDIYILSAINELLVIVDGHSKSIKSVVGFKKKLLNQPEGITFEPDGTLYISSEKGSADEAVILKYKMIN